MSLTVYHCFPAGSSNLGDGLVATAIRRALVERLGPIRFVDLPASRRHAAPGQAAGLCRENVDQINAHADLLVVGGSNLLEPWQRSFQSDRQAQWGVACDVESIRRIQAPVMLYGMGTGSGFGKPVPVYRGRVADEIRALHQKAFASAVRDTTTAGRLAQIGVEAVCTGCPVTFFTDAPIKPASTRAPLLVSFPPARILRRFFGRRFMAMAMQYLAGLQRQGVDFVVTLHDASDVEVAPKLCPPGSQIFYTTDQDELVERFRDCQGVIGFRLHAGLLAMGLGKPIVPVGVDWRGLAMIETFDLHEQSIRPFRWGQLAKLERLTQLLLTGDRALLGPLNAAKSYFRARTEEFLERMVERFGVFHTYRRRAA